MASAPPKSPPVPKTCGERTASATEPDDPKSGVVPRKSRAGRWRATVLLAVHVAIALHIAHWWNSGSTMTPLEPSESMEFSKHGVINAGLIFFALAILSTAIFGRFFCGWACHLVALQDGCRWLLEKLGLRPRPVQLGLLGAVPWIAFVYMFLAPLLHRAVFGNGVGVGEVQLTTNLFWATFPGWAMALTTFVVCGGALVYFLGAKGFCTYACPYGAIFGIADQLAPVRIRVTDACNGCGHCTAVCTSNVRVHQEVRDWKAIVDPGCMKCLDCVSVCPTDALYVGLGAPSLWTTRAKPARKAGASLGSRFLGVALTAAFMWSTFALLLFHGGEFQPLFSLMLLAPSVVVALAFGGKAERPGAPGFGENLLLAVAFLIGLFAFRGYPMFPGVNEGVPLLLAFALAALTAFFALQIWRMVRLPNALWQARELMRAKRPTRAGWGFVAVALPFALLTGDGIRTRINAVREHSKLELDVTRARSAYERGVARAQLGDFDGAIAAFEEAVNVQPEFLEARENLAGMYCAAGRFAEGIAQYTAALAINPTDADTHFMIGRAYAESGDLPAAERHWQTCVTLKPEHGPGHLGLAELAELRGDGAAARGHRDAARQPGQ